jgi:hypothetical protein
MMAQNEKNARCDIVLCVYDQLKYTRAYVESIFATMARQRVNMS